MLMEFIPGGPIDHRSALVQVMAWRQTGTKPLPEPMMTQFTKENTKEEIQCNFGEASL